MPKIMIVDDDATIQMELEEYLTHMDYAVVGTADTGEGAIEMARERDPDLILMDVSLPGEMDGISAAKKIKEEMDVAVVFITGFGDPEHIERAKLVEPFGYVMKPFDEREINGVIEIALYKKEMELKLRKANEQLEQTNRDLKQEIKERKQTEEVLRVSEERMRLALDGTEEGIWDWNPQTGEISVDPNWQRILGYEPGEKDYTFDWWEKSIHPDSFPIFEEALNAYLEGEAKYYELEYQMRTKTGDSKWIWARGKCVEYDDQGQPIRFIGTHRDISGRKQREEALRKNQETLQRSHLNLKSLLENTDDYILISDDKGSPLLFNSSYERIIKEALGIQMKPGLKPHKLLPDKDMVDFWDELHLRALRGEKFRAEHSQEFRNGDIRHFEISFTPIIENGEIKGFSELTRDITEKKQAQEALRESEKLYRDIFEKNNAIKWVIDPSSGEIVDANPAACEFYQYSHEEITKLHVWDINMLGEADLRKLVVSAESDEKTEFTFKHRLASGEIRHVQIYTGNLETGGKKLLHSIIIDITDRKRAEEALRESEARHRELVENYEGLLEDITDKKNMEAQLQQAIKMKSS